MFSLRHSNLLNNEMRNSIPISEFKRNLIVMIRPEKNPDYGINDIICVKQLSNLWQLFCVLHEHRFRHNFNCLNPICLCGIAKENSEHFLLHHCPIFDEAQRAIHGSLLNVLRLELGEQNTPSLCHLVLYGSPGLTQITNRMEMEAPVNVIKTMKRFVV